MVKLRIDVDYAYPSRVKSFIFLVLGAKFRGYLSNAKILANMIGRATVDVEAYWFFTVKTLPDPELLDLIADHEIGVHIVNDPYKEWRRVERIVKRRVTCYSVHGTANPLTRLMWRRWRIPRIPADFPLRPVGRTLSLDYWCRRCPPDKVIKLVYALSEDYFLLVHPIWLFRRGLRRGPSYFVLNKLLGLT